MPTARQRIVLAALAGGVVGTTAGSALVTWLTGRSRQPIDGLDTLNPPPGLPEAKIIPIPDRGEMFVRDHPGPAHGADHPPIVLLHGWLASADLNWFTNYEEMGKLARVIAPDHRGHGRGTRHSSPFRLADVADDVAALIRHLDLGPSIIVGFSMGGPITQLLWQRHPDVVAGVVLCSTASEFRFGPLSGAQWRWMSVYQVGTRLLPRSWLEWALVAQLRGKLPVSITPVISPEMEDAAPPIPWLVGEIERGDAEDVSEAGRELGRFDSRGWIGGMDRPAAVIVTTRDRLVPLTSQLELAARIPHALITEVEGDHDAAAANATEFNAALQQSVAYITDRL
ncbi:alpha/beta fold hydrolase [Euzebya tangerina]|uniref:alpha/beta fold hydrolase n=1 Tax=Euzebya tangerina TaxID=591198 RepID=UPI000E315890|nr:alpha/beta hydrolase [Euzebya tangerina]